VVALAEEVSPVVNCSPRDIARLERLKAAPEDLIDIQRCVALVAGMGPDALRPETQQGLAAGGKTISLDALDRSQLDG